MYIYNEEEINEHRVVRNLHEEETDKLLISWIEKYFPNTYIVNRTNGEWEKFDYLIYSIPKQTYCKVECKQRNLTQQQYDKYKDEGFALSYDKINTADVIIYIIPLTNEILQIRTSKLKQLLNENKIKICQKYVNRYQYTTYKEKHNESLILIPKQYWKVYNL